MKIKAGLSLPLPLLLLLFFAAPFPVKAQTPEQKPRRITASKTTNGNGYYLDITRPDCCALSEEKWGKIAANLKAKGIPAFFGTYRTLEYGVNWRPVKLRRTANAREGWLILGPFASDAAAIAVLRKLPALLPKNGDTFNGIEAGATSDSQTWRVGMYQIGGFRTSLPVEIQKPIVRQPGTIEGVVVENTGGANWVGIVVESGGVRYAVQLEGNSGGVKSQTGDVEKIGNRVRVTFRDKRRERDGSYSLDATRIVQIKK